MNYLFLKKDNPSYLWLQKRTYSIKAKIFKVSRNKKGLVEVLRKPILAC